MTPPGSYARILNADVVARVCEVLVRLDRATGRTATHCRVWWFSPDTGLRVYRWLPAERLVPIRP